MVESKAQWLEKQPQRIKDQFWAALSSEEKRRLRRSWPFWARPEQMEPIGDWIVWLIMAGRGFGKARGGGEWGREGVKRVSLVNLIGETVDDARDMMIGGE